MFNQGLVKNIVHIVNHYKGKKENMKKKLIAALLLASINLFLLLTKCNPNQNPQLKTPEWSEVKTIIKKETISVEDYNKIISTTYYQISPDEIDEIINIYNNSKNKNIRKLLLKILANNIYFLKESNNFEKIIILYQNIVKSNDKTLSPIALKGLADAEGDLESKKWEREDWSWSKELINFFEEAVNKNLYKLSELENLQLLALANKYPDSLFTKGCKEYAKFTGGTYFFEGTSKGFRKPFNPQIQINFWKNFVKKYPGHPGSNDAFYRVARAYELQGDYENSVIYYYEASEAPDGLLRDVARLRIIFVVDLLTSSELLDKFLTNHHNHPLTPYVKYSKAVHLIREYKYSSAESELDDFLKNYQDGKYFELVSNSSSEEGSYLDANFWNQVKEQLNQVKKLAEIRNKQPSDKSLYEEAKLWIDKDKKDDGFTAYNYLWNRGLRRTFQFFIPSTWEGNKTYSEWLINADFMNKANRNYEKQISYLISIKLFKQLIEKYPQSELVEKAKYSIALNYYYLWGREYPIFSNNVTSWKDTAIKSFEDFIKEFPNSSMADNASYTIQYIERISSQKK
jgi:TolA-binding protein